MITNGISMSASNLIATRYMKLFAHVPILLVDQPDDVLVVCFGTGQTTGAAAIHPRVKSVDSLELSTSVINAGKMFADQNHQALAQPQNKLCHSGWPQPSSNYSQTLRCHHFRATASPHRVYRKPVYSGIL